MNTAKFDFIPRRLLSARRLCAVAALCLLAGRAGAQDFSISTLTPNNAVVVDVNSLVGDDRGGIAVSGSQVFLTGDAATARFNRDTLNSGVSLGVVRDGLVANLATSTVYLLGNASSNALPSGGGTFATLIELNGSTGVPSGNVIALSTPVTLTGSSASVGIFSGWNRVVVHTGTRAYRVSLPDGTVTDLGAMATPTRTASESWAYWGVAENVGSDTYITYVRNSTTISRTKVPSGPTTTVATFANLSDMASFTVSVAQNRWYFHHESSSQFGAFSESLGYADATFVSAPVAPTIAVQPVGTSIYVGESASFSATANGTGPLAYQWLKNGSPITDATNTTYSIGVAALADAGSYSLVVTNVSGSVTSSVAVLTVSAVDADLFKIIRLTASNAVVVDPLNYAGDDRGGLVATDQKIYLRGDDSVGSFNLNNLGGGIRLGTNFGALTNFFFYDSLVSDLRAQKAYVLGGGGTNILGIFGGTVSNLVELHGSNGVPTGTTITLSTPIVMPGTGLYNANVGIFSGWGRIVLHNGTRAYSINTASGTVTDLGAMTFPTHINSESWASWGVAEYWGGSHYIVYARDAQTIVRTRIPDGATTVISTFSNLNDLANFTVVPGLNRWYFHNESVNQFTNYNNFGAEVLGYADAAFLYQAPQATIVSQPQSLTVTVGSSATFSVSATAVAALSYQWKTNGVAIAGATGSSVTFANAQLTDSGLVFSVTVMDGGDPIDSANATLTVLPNFAPTLTVPGPVTVLEDAGSQTNLVTGISAGPAHESGQLLLVTATSDNPALTGPLSVSYASGTATLRHTNTANAFGTALITVVVSDNGGTLAGGVDSATNAFLLTVTPVNDAPSATRLTNNVVVLEDVGSTGVAGFLSAISVGPGETQGLSVSIANNNNALFLVQPALNLGNGDLTFTPAPNAFGSATVTYILTDTGGTANGGVDASTNTFTITVTGVNDAPTLALGVTTVNVLTNAGAFTTNIAPVATVGPASETNSQTIVGYVTSNDNNALFSVQPTLGLNGNLNFTVAGTNTGTAVVSIQAQDSGDNLNGGTNRSAVAFVLITVSGPNQAPTFTLATNNLVVAEDSGSSSIIAFLFGLSAGEVTQSVTNLTTSNNNSNLFSAQPVFTGSGPTRTLTFTPAANANGAATVTVSATDDGSSPATGTQTFTITVTPVNDAPSFAVNTSGFAVVGTVAGGGATAYGWGTSSYGQIGAGSGVTSTNRPAQVVNVTNFTMVSGEDYHSVALHADGTVWTWGRNDGGQLANGFVLDDGSPNSRSFVPLQVPGLTGVVAVEAGFSWSMALKADGTVWTWGINSIGQLGLGTNGSAVTAPAQVPALSNITAIVAAGAGGMALRSDGTLWTWGHNGNGQLGRGTAGVDDPTPGQVTTLGSAVSKVFSSIFATRFVQKTDGTIWAWGVGDHGQFGDGTTGGGRLTVPTPFKVTNLGTNEVVSMDAGIAHTLALMSDGTVKVFGNNGNGQYGNGTTGGDSGTPVTVPGLSGIASVRAGNATSYALGSNGLVYAWGSDNSGQLGQGFNMDQVSPVQVTIISNVTQISAGQNFALALGTPAAPLTGLGLNEDAGPQSVALFATNILAGPANESGQSVAFTVTNDNNALFSSQPAIAANGTLTFTPAANAFGLANVGVIIVDNGGAPGVSNSVAQTFAIAITNVNDAPAITFATNNVVVLEDAGAQSSAAFLSLSPGPFSESGTVSLTSVANNNNALFSSQPAFTGSTLTFTPAADANGSATVTVIAQDDTGLFSTNSFTLTVLPVNDMPTLSLTNLVITVLTNSGGFSGQLGATINFGAANETNQAPASFLITNNNNALFTTQPSANQAGFLSFSIAPGQVGTATLFVRVQDTGGTANGGVDVSAPVLVTVNVSPGNSAPSFTLVTNAVTVFEDSGSASGGILFGLSPGSQPFEAGQFVTVTTANNNSNLFVGQPFVSGGTLFFTPALNAFGSATVTITATDDGSPALSTSQNVTITVLPVNDAPSFSVASNVVFLIEDAGSQVVANALTNISAGPNEAAQTVVFQVSNNNSNLFSVQPAIVGSGASRNLTFTLAPNASGVATVLLAAVDNGGTSPGMDTSGTQTIIIDVMPVNDPPTVTFATNNVAVLEDSGLYSAPHATFTTPTNDLGQAIINVQVSNNNSNLFALQPTLDAGGTLTFVPAANANGSATVTVRAQDNGGTANGGVDLSAPTTFTITVTAVNDAPVFTLPNTTIPLLEDAGAQTIAGFATNILGGLPADEAAQNVTFVISNDSSNKFTQLPAINGLGVLTFTLAPNANGTIVVSVVAQDNGGTNNGGVNVSAPQLFGIVVTPVNDAPTVSYATNNVVVLEDSGPAGAGGFATFFLPADEAGQSIVSVVATNNNNALFAVQPSFGLDGTLTFTPAANAFGSAVVTVVATDNGGTDNGGQNTSAATTFTITVTAVNDAPSFNVAVNPVGVLEDSGAATVPNAVTNISAGPGGESQSVAFLTSNNASNLFTSIGQPVIGAGGTLTFTPAPNANGAALVTIVAQDTGGTNNGGLDTSSPQTLTILITNINDAPLVTFATNNLVRLEDSGTYSAPGFATFSAPADELGQVLLGYTVTTSSNALFSVLPAIANDGTLTFTPAANAFGVATVTVIAQDNGGTANGGVDASTNTFTLTLTGVNDAPTLALPFGYVYVETNSGGFHTNLAPVTSTGPNETGQFIQDFITTNNQPSFFTVQPYLLPNGDLDFTLANGVSGIVTLTIHAHDSGGTNNGGVDLSAPVTFTIFVGVFNVAPGFSFATNDVVVPEDSGAQTFVAQVGNISTGSPGEIGQTVSLTTGNNNPVLFSVQPSVAANGTLTFTPATNAFGSATVTVIAADSGLPALFTTNTFTITVTPVNDAPSFALPPGTGGPAGTTWVARESIRDWMYMASSADGTKLAAVVANGQIYVSADAGLTWTARESVRNWAEITMSADGTKLAATVTGGQIYTSADAGVTWTARESSRNWRDITSSADGTLVAALHNGGQIYVSTDSGATWTPRASNLTWTGITCTPDGTILVATHEGGMLYRSTDSGVTWAALAAAGARNWRRVCISADGTKIAAGTYGEFVHLSADSGVTWAPATSLGTGVWYDIACSSDGTKLVTGKIGGQLYTSSDSGATWTARDSNRSWLGVVSSSDGSRLAATVTGGQIYTSVGDVQPPSITVLEDSGPQTNAAFATSILAGPANESGQVLSFIVTNNNPARFDVQPAIDASGTLTFTPGTNRNGSAVVTVYLQDNGGTTNGGVDLAGPLAFTITLTPVNDPPTIAFATNNVVVLEDSGAFSGSLATFATPPSNEGGQSITNVVTSNNSSNLFSVQPTVSTAGTLTFTPATNANGSATVTVIAQDNGGTDNGGVNLATNTFTITVTPVNDAPSFTLPVPASGSSLTLASSNFFGGAGDQRGTSISIAGGAVYLSGNVQPETSSSSDSALALRFATPPGAAPVWSRFFNSGSVLLGVATTAEGVYAGGASYTLTSDPSGGKEVKAIVAKFPLDGSVGPGSEGATWVAGSGGTGSRAAFFAYGGTESFYATATATEAGAPVIYAAGFGQPASYSAYIVAKYDAAGNLVASATDSSVGISFGSFFIPSTGGSSAGGVTVLSNKVFAVGQTSWSSEGDTGGRPVLWLYATNLTLTVRQRDTSLFGSFNAVAPLGGAVYAVGQTGPSGGAASTQDFLVQKFDVDGNRLWSASWGGADEDVLRGVTSVGSRLFVGGYTRSMGAGGSDAVVFELDPATGSVLSTNLFGGTQDDRANGLASDGTDFYLVGESKSFAFAGNTAGENDGMLLRFTPGLTVPVLEDAGPQTTLLFATNIVAGPADESAQVVSFVVTNSATNLFLVQPAIGTDGILTFTPATNAVGSATVTVYAQDDGGTNNGGVDLAGPQTFTITVTAVNDAPSATFASNPLEVMKNSAPTNIAGFATFSKGPADESSQSITNVTVSNNNSALFDVGGEPTIDTSGNLFFKPAAGMVGTATVTVITEDNGGTANGGVNLGTNTFVINVASTKVFVESTAPVRAGNQVVVPVSILADGDENGVGFTLTFDPTILSYGGLSAESGISVVPNTNQLAAGRLGVVLSKAPDSTFGAGTWPMIYVTFNVAATAPATNTPVGFTSDIAYKQVTDKNAAIFPYVAWVPNVVTITALSTGLEGDVTPRPTGNGSVTVSDAVQIGRFAAGLDTITNFGPGSEFQRADCAPIGTFGDGMVTVADWVAAMRFAAGLETPGAAAGPDGGGPLPLGLRSARAKLPAGLRAVRVAGGGLVAGRANTVSVQIDAQGNEAGVQLSLKFDPSVLTYVGATTGRGAAGATLLPNDRKAAAGQVGLVLLMPVGTGIAAGTQDIITLTFHVTGGAGSTAISVAEDSLATPREVADVNANSVGTAYTGGSFNILLPAGLKAAGMERAADGSLRLVVRNSDGTPVTAAQAAKYEVHVTSNLGGAWTVLPNALVVENGALKIVDPAAGAAGLRLYKLVETP